MKTHISAFSLIEVVVFTAILSLFFVAGASITTYSLQTMKSNEYKVRATVYAEELMEWIKTQKENNWTDFVNTYVTSSGKSYCFNSSPVASWTSAQSGTDPKLYGCTIDNFGLASSFRRSVSLIPYNTPIDKVQITIVVQWKEPAGTATVPLNSYLTVWE